MTSLGFIARGFHTVKKTSITFKGGTITGETTLSAADSGTTYTIDLPTNDYDINLPTTTAGLNYRFVVGSTSGNGDVKIRSTGAHLNGTVLMGTSGTSGPHALLHRVAGGVEIHFQGSFSALGDSLEIIGVSDNMWFIRATGVTDESIEAI